jgi:hypothetical protein
MMTVPSNRLFSTGAWLGQACTHAPQLTHSDAKNNWSWLAATID